MNKRQMKKQIYRELGHYISKALEEGVFDLWVYRDHSRPTDPEKLRLHRAVRDVQAELFDKSGLKIVKGKEVKI